MSEISAARVNRFNFKLAYKTIKGFLFERCGITENDDNGWTWSRCDDQINDNATLYDPKSYVFCRLALYKVDASLSFTAEKDYNVYTLVIQCGIPTSDTFLYEKFEIRPESDVCDFRGSVNRIKELVDKKFFCNLHNK